MEKMKNLFKSSRLGLGVAIGATAGYITSGSEMDGVFGFVIVVSFIIIIAENLITSK